MNVKFLDGTKLEVAFQDGQVKQFDMACLFEKYPQLAALRNRNLFEFGRLMGAYGIVWNDELDIETESIYEEGVTVRTESPAPGQIAAEAVRSARAAAQISQAELAAMTGIDQSDISRIERGMANPSVGTLSRIANALHMQLGITLS